MRSGFSCFLGALLSCAPRLRLPVLRSRWGQRWIISFRLTGHGRLSCHLGELEGFVAAFLNRAYDMDLRSPRTIVDIGANVGMATVWFGVTYASAAIVAIEPNPRAVQLLRRNVESNGLGDRVRILDAAVAASSGIASFKPSTYSVESTLGQGPGSISVNTITLEEVLGLAGHRPIPLLKLDCEGCEVGLLGQAAEGLPQSCTAVVGEYHDVSIGERIHLRLMQLGFDARLERHGDQGLFKGWRRGNTTHAWPRPIMNT
jgi:FkbM family methyltransferase